MIVSTANLNDFSHEASLRMDVDYFNYLKNIPASYYSFDDLFELVDSEKVDLTLLDTDFKYNEIGDVSKEGDVEPNILNFNDRNLLNEDLFKKIEKGDIMAVDLGDILISKVRPNLKKYIYIDNTLADQFFTTAFIKIRARQHGKIMYFALRTLFFDTLMAISRQGKGYPTLNENDLVTMRFDRKTIDNLLSKSDDINNTISDLENTMSSLKANIYPIDKFTNEQFCSTLHVPFSIVEDIRKGMSFGTQPSKNTSMYNFNVDLSKVCKYKTMRISARSQNPVFANIDALLRKFDLFELKNIVVEKIHNGDSPVYVDDGVIPVVKTMHLSNSGLKTEFDGFVSAEQFENTPEANIHQGDLLICNIGKCSLGKVDVNYLEDEMFAATEVMIVRIDETKFLKEFILHYLRSVFGVYQFEREYTGTTNQIHISPEIVERFLIPNISLDEQRLIVDEIENMSRKQEDIKKQISEARNNVETHFYEL